MYRLIDFIFSHGLILIPALVGLLIICGVLLALAVPGWIVLAVAGLISGLAICLCVWLNHVPMIGG